jgi:phosphoserine aminotransferase
VRRSRRSKQLNRETQRKSAKLVENLIINNLHGEVLGEVSVSASLLCINTNFYTASSDITLAIKNGAWRNISCQTATEVCVTTLSKHRKQKMNYYEEPVSPIFIQMLLYV